MTPNCIVIIIILPPICCHIGSGMPDRRIFVEDVLALSGALALKGV